MKALATGSSHSLPDMGLLLPSGVPVDVTPEQFLQLMNLGLEGVVLIPDEIPTAAEPVISHEEGTYGY